MRIISGSEKGRKLFSPPSQDKTIRPTSDKAREAIFSILGGSVAGAKVLDLFAGTGAMGLEALSRKAAFVIFVDNDRLALELIKRNIALCLANYKGDGEIRVIQHDLSQGLPLKKFPPETLGKFDLIFADPPYSRNISQTILNTINDSSILAENGLLILEERYNAQLPEQLSNLEIIDRRTYGECGFWLYKPVASGRST